MRLLGLAAAVLLLTGCSAPGPELNANCEQPAIELEQIELGLSVASVANGAAAIVSALGGRSSLVASDLASEVGVDVINPGHQIAVEELLALNPNIIFVGSDEPDELALQAIATLGATVITLDPPITFADSMEQILLIAQALGVPERGIELREKIASAIEAVDARALVGSDVAFLYLRGNAGVFLISGEGSGADDLIRLLGANDVGVKLGVRGFAPISPEALAEANPDFIVVMQKGLESVGGVDALLRLPGVMGTKAAATDGVLTAKDSQLLSFGPATAGVLQCLVAQAN